MLQVFKGISKSVNNFLLPWQCALVVICWDSIFWVSKGNANSLRKFIRCITRGSDLFPKEALVVVEKKCKQMRNINTGRQGTGTGHAHQISTTQITGTRCQESHEKHSSTEEHTENMDFLPWMQTGKWQWPG